MKTKKRKTNWDRVVELNAILGDELRKRDGWFFSLLKNAKDFRHPYCLCYSYEVKNSLSFKGMKEMALRMRAAYDAGGDRMAVYKARCSC